MENDLLFSFFLIFTSAAVLATVALFTRQPLIVAYIAIGVILGPWLLNYRCDSLTGALKKPKFWREKRWAIIPLFYVFGHA